MFTILHVVVLCFLLFSSATTVTEDDDLDMRSGVCTDLDFAALLYKLSLVWERHPLHDFFNPLLYSTLVVVPLIPFLCFLLPHRGKERPHRRYKEETERKQGRREINSSPIKPRIGNLVLERRLRNEGLVNMMETCKRNQTSRKRTEPVYVSSPGKSPDQNTESSADSNTLLEEL